MTYKGRGGCTYRSWGLPFFQKSRHKSGALCTRQQRICLPHLSKLVIFVYFRPKHKLINSNFISPIIYSFDLASKKRAGKHSRNKQKNRLAQSGPDQLSRCSSKSFLLGRTTKKKGDDGILNRVIYLRSWVGKSEGSVKNRLEGPINGNWQIFRIFLNEPTFFRVPLGGFVEQHSLYNIGYCPERTRWSSPSLVNTRSQEVLPWKMVFSSRARRAGWNHRGMST